MFKVRLDKALVILKGLGVSRNNYAPLTYRLMWLLKIPIPPPHYRSLPANIITTGGLFVLMFWTLMWITGWSTERSLYNLAFVGIMTGVVFGVVMAYSYEKAKKKYDLASWENLDSQ